MLYRNLKVGVFMEGNLHVIGGRERVVVDLIKALNILGHEVHYCSPFELDMDLVGKNYQEVSIDKIYHLTKGVVKFAKGSILRKGLLINKFKEMARNVDVIIDLEGGLVQNFIPPEFKKENYIVWRVGIPLNRVETKGFLRWIHKYFANLLLKPSKNFRIVFVDKYTRQEVEKHWKLNSDEFLYPEIQVGKLKYDGKGKENIIVALGRITPGKKIEVPIEAFAKIADKLKNYKLRVLGGVDVKDNDYLEFIREKIKKLDLENRVELLPDCPFIKIKESLLRGKVLINAQEDASMHITVIEAMAAGCVPFVHKSGGSWNDILENGKYGFGFNDVDDCAIGILSLLSDERKLGKFSELAMERSEDFSEKAFRNNLQKILDSCS